MDSATDGLLYGGRSTCQRRMRAHTLCRHLASRCARGQLGELDWVLGQWNDVDVATEEENLELLIN